MACDDSHPRPFWQDIVRILSGFLLGACLAGSIAASWVFKTLARLEATIPLDPSNTSIVSWLLVFKYGFWLVAAAGIMGGLAGILICVLLRRFTGKLPIFSYICFDIALILAVVLWWLRPSRIITQRAAERPVAVRENEVHSMPDMSPDQLRQDCQSRFIEAARNGNLVEVEHLLKQGSDVNGSYKGRRALCEASYNDRRDVVRYLLEHNASIDREEPIALMTPLMFAASANHREMVTLLLDHGADPHVDTWDGHGTGGTAMKYAHDPQIREMLADADKR